MDDWVLRALKLNSRPFFISTFHLQQSEFTLPPSILSLLAYRPIYSVLSPHHFAFASRPPGRSSNQVLLPRSATLLSPRLPRGNIISHLNRTTNKSQEQTPSLSGNLRHTPPFVLDLEIDLRVSDWLFYAWSPPFLKFSVLISREHIKYNQGG
jgi:hypothetical protein